MSTTSPPADGIDQDPPVRGRRSWGQRVVLGLGVVVSVAAMIRRLWGEER